MTDKPKCTAVDGKTEVHNMPGVGLVVSAAAFNALVRDAERYRWLCSYTIIPAPSLWDNGVGFVTPALPRKSGAMNKQELDTAIDAMQEKQS